MVKAISSINLNNKAQIHFKASIPQETVQMPTSERNYCVFNQDRVNYFVSQKEQALPYLKNVLLTSNDEKEIVEALYIIDRLAENKVKGIPHMYPILARFNDTNSPNIQVYLAGIYRKTQVPDAFGPLVSMLVRNSINYPSPLPSPARGEGVFAQPFDHSTVQPPFDPTEEIGGAILEYIHQYSTGTPKIDYSA